MSAALGWLAYAVPAAIVWWPVYEFMLGFNQREYPALWSKGDRGVGWSVVVATLVAVCWPLPAVFALVAGPSFWLWRGRTFPWSPKPDRERVNR